MTKINKVIFSFILLGFVLLFAPSAFASSLTLISSITSLDNTTEFPVDVTLSLSAQDGTVYYLRGVFYQAGGQNYCGFTWNGTSWFSGPYTTNNGWKSFLPITITNNTWTGQIKAKIDPTDSGCQKTGQYLFKIERFTGSGSGSYDTQNELNLTITIPTPTPSPTDVLSPTPTQKPPTPTPTPKVLTATLVVKSSTTTTLAVSSPTPTFLTPTIIATQEGEVLGSQSSEVSPTTTLVASAKEKKSTNFFPVFLFGGAGLVLIICGILFSVQFIKKSKNETGNNNKEY